MNLAAIRHEATQEYCFCLEPGKFLFRLQTGKDDLCRVTLHSRAENSGRTEQWLVKIQI